MCAVDSAPDRLGLELTPERAYPLSQKKSKNRETEGVNDDARRNLTE